MAENKTKPEAADPVEFLNKIESPEIKKDCLEIMEMMRKISGFKPVMWGDAMVGFGICHYKYESGREGDMFRIGFSPRKQNITLYMMVGFTKYDELLKRLGKHKTSKSCLYIKKLADIDKKVLTELIELSLDHINKKYPD